MSTPTVTLTQDSNSSLSGVNLKWTYSNVGPVKEIALIYFKNVSSADIASVEIASGLTKYFPASRP